MLKNLLQLLFVLFFFSSVCFSQGNSCKKGHCLKGDVGYISFSIGPSIPVGNFADNDPNNPNAGCANPGSRIEINSGFRLIKSIDFIVKLFYSINGYDVSTLKNKLSIENPSVIWTTTGRNWDIFGGLFGLNYSHSFSRKLTGDFKFETGLMHSSTGQMILNGSNGTKITESERSASSFAYLISAGAHYPVGRLVDVIGSLDYLSSSPTFNNISRVTTLPGGSSTNLLTPSSSQSISMLSFNLGFRVKF